VPGILQANPYVIDDAIFAPFVFGPGSLRPTLVNALDAVFAPVLTTPLTLKPSRHLDSDSAPSPTIRQNMLFALLVDDVDTFYIPSRTSPTVLGGFFVVDVDASYAPIVGATATLSMNLLAGDDIVHHPSEAGGDPTFFANIFNDPETFYAPGVSGIPTSFDGATSFVALSPDKLTVTHSSTTNNAGARSTAQKTTGKFYFEVVMTTTHGDSDCPGLISSIGAFSNVIGGGIQCTVAYRATGNIFSNGGNTGKTLGSCTSGDNIGIAVDLTAHKAWFRKNGGLWNGLVLTSENPNAGVGGVTVQSSLMAPVACFGGANTATNDAMTANFGGTPFVYAAPTGFGMWTA
jgi:hypothetical protein